MVEEGQEHRENSLCPSLQSTLGSLFVFLLQADWELISVETTASDFYSEYMISQGQTCISLSPVTPLRNPATL